MPGGIARRELIRRFRVLGLLGPFSGKRHQFMQKGALKVRIPNPHRSAAISEPLLQEILRQAESRLSSGSRRKAGELM